MASTPVSADQQVPMMLVVSDDEHVRMIIDGAVGHRFRIATCATAREVHQRLASTPPDFVVIDVPSASCWQVEMVEVVASVSAVPSVVIARENSASLCVLSLRLGADDFVTVDVEPEVLAARVHAVRRRGLAAAEQMVVHAAGLTIDLAARSVMRERETIHLTPIEFDLLAYLAKHPRRALSREQLLGAVWGSDSNWQGVATVTEHVRRLRLKLGESDGVIATVYGIGYRFDPTFSSTLPAAVAGG